MLGTAKNPYRILQEGLYFCSNDSFSLRLRPFSRFLCIIVFLVLLPGACPEGGVNVKHMPFCGEDVLERLAIENVVLVKQLNR